MWVEYDRENQTINKGRAALGAIGKNPILPEKEFRPFWKERKSMRIWLPGWRSYLSRSIDESIRGRESRPYKTAAIKGLTYDLVHQLFGLSPEAPWKG